MATDFGAVRHLADDLGKVPGRLVNEVRGTVKHALQNVKDGTRANLSDHPSWRRLEPTVTYELYSLAHRHVSGGASLAGEVGYEDRGQGELAGIHEFGTEERDPHPALLPAAAEEQTRFVRALGLVKAFNP